MTSHVLRKSTQLKLLVDGNKHRSQSETNQCAAQEYRSLRIWTEMLHGVLQKKSARGTQ